MYSALDVIDSDYKRRGSWASDVVICNGTSSVNEFESDFSSVERLRRIISYDDDGSNSSSCNNNDNTITTTTTTNNDDEHSQHCSTVTTDIINNNNSNYNNDDQSNVFNDNNNNTEENIEQDDETELRRIVSYDDDNNNNNNKHNHSYQQHDNNYEDDEDNNNNIVEEDFQDSFQQRQQQQQQQQPKVRTYSPNSAYDDETNRIIMRMRLRMGSLFDQEEPYYHNKSNNEVQNNVDHVDDEYKKQDNDDEDEHIYDTNNNHHEYYDQSFSAWKDSSPPPPPPPPLPRQHQTSHNNMYLNPTDHSPSASHHNELKQDDDDDDKDDQQPALCRSDTSESFSSESRSSSATSCIQKQLSSYGNIIRNRLQRNNDEKSMKEFTDVQQLMLRDPNLTEREAAAFLQGVTLQLHASPATNTAAMSTNNLKKRINFDDTVDFRQKAASTVSASPLDQKVSRMMSRVKNNDDSYDNEDAQTSISVMSTMSCRELSIQRLQRRIAKTSLLSTEQQRERDGDVQRIKELLQELQEAEARQKRLEKQLEQAGVCIAEDIPYEEAKEQVARISIRLQEIGDSQATHADATIQATLRREYFVLEQKMETYTRALELTDEYREEQDRMERAWDAENEMENHRALEQVWNHMPVDFRQRNWKEWMEIRTPNGKHVPKQFLLKFSRTNVLSLIRMSPHQVRMAHPSNLEQRAVTGLTLTERRALYAYLKPIAQPHWQDTKDASTQRKWKWYTMMRNCFKEAQLSYQHHVDQYGKQHGGGCPCRELNCPVRADQKLDYFIEDYGYPCSLDYPEYEAGGQQTMESDIHRTSSVIETNTNTKEKEQQEEKRQSALKLHYQGKISEFSLASASCVAMDELMDTLEQLQDTWIQEQWSKNNSSNDDDAGGISTERKAAASIAKFNDALVDLRLALLPLAERSGMSISGTKSDKGGEDKRSLLETVLCDDVYQVSMDFLSYIREQKTKLALEDKRLQSMLEQLQQLLEEMKTRNATFLAAQTEEDTIDSPLKNPRKSRTERTSILWAQHRTQLKQKVKQKVVKVTKNTNNNSIESNKPSQQQGDGKAAFMKKARPAKFGNLLQAISARGRN